MSEVHRSAPIESSAFADTHKLQDKIRLNPKGEPLTWGATPGNSSGDRGLLQLEVRESLHRLHEESVPIGTPDQVVRLVSSTFDSRFTGRAVANYENYHTALIDHPQGTYLDNLHSRALDGTASPAELLLVRNKFGIRSVELGCLSHPYGTHVEEYLPLMRASIKDAVVIFDGLYIDSPQPVYAVKQYYYPDNNPALPFSALLMTRKRDFGFLKDGTVVRERSSFLLRLDDESGINPEIAAVIRNIRPIKQDGNEKDSKKIWATRIMEEAHLAQYVDSLLRDDNYTTAVPVSTTAYAFNAKTKELIMKRDSLARETSSDDDRLVRNRIEELFKIAVRASGQPITPSMCPPENPEK